MGIFNNKYQYKTPERITPSEARERRLTGLLERERRFEEVPNFLNVQKRIAAERSRVTTTNIVNDGKISRQKAASIAAAFAERDFADPHKRAAYRALRKFSLGHTRSHNELMAELTKIKAREGQQKSTPSGGNKSYFNPTGKDFAATTSGTVARIGRAIRTSFMPSFRMPTTVIPCIQRHAQREVMFAKGHAGRGYHTKKRRNWSSGVPC